MKITIERSRCIGCGSCSALCPDNFELDNTGKSHFAGNQIEEGKDIDEKDFDILGCVQDAIDGCPVQCIKIQ